MKTGRPVLLHCFVVSVFVFPGHTFVFHSSPCSLQCVGHGSREGQRGPQIKTGRWSCRAPGILQEKLNSRVEGCYSKKGTQNNFVSRIFGQKQGTLPLLSIFLLLFSSISYLLTLSLPIYLYINYLSI